MFVLLVGCFFSKYEYIGGGYWFVGYELIMVDWRSEIVDLGFFLFMFFDFFDNGGDDILEFGFLGRLFGCIFFIFVVFGDVISFIILDVFRVDKIFNSSCVLVKFLFFFFVDKLGYVVSIYYRKCKVCVIV